MSGKHSELGPSSSSRWLVCPGSVALSRGRPDDASEAAEEGTDAHELGALCLTLAADAADFIGKTLPCGNVVDAEMAQNVQLYLDFVNSLPGEESVEAWVDLEDYTGEEGGGGTADHISIGKRVLWVTDYKNGRIPVEIDGNTQTRMYALGALAQARTDGHYGLKYVTMAIIQPRCYAGPRIETITVEELRAWGRDVLLPGAEATRKPDAPLNPGTAQCQWCRAKGDCPGLAEYVATATGATDLAEFQSSFVPPAPSTLGAEQLGRIMERASLVTKWLEAVAEEATRRLQADPNTPGLKLVRGRAGNRAWSGEEDAIAAVLRTNYGLANETIFKMTLNSPTTILSLPEVKEDPDLLLAMFITRKEGALSAVPASDKRPAVVFELPAETVFNSF